MEDIYILPANYTDSDTLAEPPMAFSGPSERDFFEFL